jgi:hypothetical protein
MAQGKIIKQAQGAGHMAQGKIIKQAQGARHMAQEKIINRRKAQGTWRKENNQKGVWHRA